MKLWNYKIKLIINYLINISLDNNYNIKKLYIFIIIRMNLNINIFHFSQYIIYIFNEN